ncbi:MULTISPECIES: hypothetical protein [unclassified Ensifer]|uniref:hypothetical protein n=1 Tax=unclassified Ensifer TaxID=2633371 RepID=UPI0011466E6B|nr:MULTISPECIES: hypothetical protein [unclassified Ensifer]
MNALNSTTALAGATANQLDDLLDDLELDGLDNEEISDEVEETVVLEADAVVEEPVVTDEDLENVDIDALEINLDREEGYASQESELDVAEKPADAVAAAKGTSTPKTPRAASAPRAPRDMASLDAKVFVLEGDASTMEDGALEANKTDVMAAIPSQKKIAEKFENLFAALNAGKQPSVYVTQAFKLLDEKKTITGTDITTMFKASYKQGTAQSQSGQIMTLFEAVKIATRQKNTLVLNDSSVVAERLRAIFAAAANTSTQTTTAAAA